MSDGTEGLPWWVPCALAPSPVRAPLSPGSLVGGHAGSRAGPSHQPDPHSTVSPIASTSREILQDTSRSPPKTHYFGVARAGGRQQPQLGRGELNNGQADVKVLQYGCDRAAEQLTPFSAPR